MRIVHSLLILTAVLATGGAPDVAAAAASGTSPITRPEGLERDIAFWRRVYTEVTTQAGLIHDDAHLDIVYDVIEVPEALAPGARRKRIETAKERYVRALQSLANGKKGAFTRDEARVETLWTGHGPDELRAAAQRVRFQLGQADRFQQGLVRSGAWIDYIRATFERHGLPPELAALPHVESSFNTYAYSKVGAAGMWQFMPGTGRRYLRIDNVVDERLAPYKATEAAAEFLAQNYAVLESWPLAITAYNHGTAGMRRAREQLATDDIEQIVRRYRSRSFGFASRNFYVAFLAANEIDQSPQKFFPELRRGPVDANHAVKLSDYLPARSVAVALGVDLEILKLLNPSLLEPVWNGSRYIPRGYSLRIPPHLDFSAALDKIPAAQRYAAQVPDTHHKVRRGDTLSTLASRYDTSVARLAALNGLRPPYGIRAGQQLILPDGAPALETAAAAAVVSESGGAEYVVRSGDTVTSIADATGLEAGTLMRLNDLKDPDYLHVGQVLELAPDEAAASPPRPVEEMAATVAAVPIPGPDDQAVDGSMDVVNAVDASDSEEMGPSLVQGAGSAATADPADYSVAADRTIRVETLETLGHYAEWLDVRASRLRELNGMRYGAALPIGSRIKLDLAHVDAGAFEARRVAYHRAVQAQYFDAHRIAGSETHTVRAGESVWMLARSRDDLPLWLLRQYNPDLDLANLRPGTQLTIPVVERVSMEQST
jgi:membrane-bound lytic murein transglycosylase D